MISRANQTIDWRSCSGSIACSLIFFFLSVRITSAQPTCSTTQLAFQSGESCTYTVYYNWGALWMSAGKASFGCEKSFQNNRPGFHFVGLGATYPKYDFFFKVNDNYESYADSATLMPLRFKRMVHEGPTNNYDDYIFDQAHKKVYALSKNKRKKNQLDTIAVTACTKDVVTAIFYARCLDFSKYKPNDTIPITFVLDGAVYPSYIRYLGTEVIHSDLLGDVRCVKFKPKLVAGTLFKGGEGMTVWVTDDANHLPVYVETPIIVGSVKVYLDKYTGLKNPISSLVENKKTPSKR